MTVALCSIRELSEELGIGRTTLYSLTRKGVVPAVRIGKQLRYNIAAVERALANGNGNGKHAGAARA